MGTRNVPWLCAFAILLLLAGGAAHADFEEIAAGLEGVM